MLQEVSEEAGDSSGRNMWKKILTVKREAKITSALNKIERQKGLLNIWICQKNLLHLYDLQGFTRNIREELKDVDRSAFYFSQTVEKEVQSLSKTLDNHSRVFKSSFESFSCFIVSNFESLQKQIHEQQHQHQSESAIAYQQQNSLTKEIRDIKRELRKLAIFQSQAAHKPSLLKEATDSFPSSLTLYTSRKSKKRAFEKHYQTTLSLYCTCRRINSIGAWTFSGIANAATNYQNVYSENCKVHANNQAYLAHIRCYIQSTILRNLVKLSFEAIYGAGGCSISFGLRTSRIVHKLPLKSFFYDLYRYRSPRNQKILYWGHHNRIYNRKKQNKLLRVVHRKLLEAFNSGKASPDDVDEYGWTLLHLQAFFINKLKNGEKGFGAQIIQLLISMGVKTDLVDNNFCTAQQLLVDSDSFIIPMRKLPPDFGDNVLEWTSLPLDEVIDGVNMIESMRRWPESINEWGYPYISDILLRKSKSDLESFIRQNMKPKEETFRLLTPLHLAAAANWPEAVKLLLASGADKCVQDSELWFPIDFAIQTKCLESINLLLDGDCLPYFTSPRGPSWRFLNIPVSIFRGLTGNSEGIRRALLSAIFRHKNSLEHASLYHGLIGGHKDDWSRRIYVRLVETLLSEGVPGLNAYNDSGCTPLMRACTCNDFEMVRVLVENGASISECHRDSGLTAGHFLAVSGYFTPPPNSTNLDLHRKLLQIGFDMSNMAKFSCRCSPGGYTPLTAIIRRHKKRARDCLHFVIDCLRWPTEISEKEIRTFALAMIFDRLGITHTCPWSKLYIRHQSFIPNEDRLEIEDEEEELHNRLKEIMKEYDMSRAKFKGGALEFLDYFFELHEYELADEDHWGSHNTCNSYDTDLLGPGRNYNFSQLSFAGKRILHRHTEEVKEEHMLALLFREEE
ncbi:hypothetical protein B0O99DRAFT_675868 [Bisporella sp. PMI_857]|nr:hypothetical protein B0O99DRAFT_675868 [Bisporella sp. PMI_857]